MANQMHRVLVDKIGDGPVEEGEFGTCSQAIDYAERRAMEYFGGEDVTWSQRQKITTPKGVVTYGVGRILEDGTRSEPMVRIVVEEVEVDQDHVINEEFD